MDRPINRCMFLDSNYQLQDNVGSQFDFERNEIRFGGDINDRLNSHPNFSLFPTGFQYYEDHTSMLPNGPH